MRNERDKKLIELGLASASLITLYKLLTGSFSFSVRQQIRDRAGYKSEISGTPDYKEPCECSHLNHDKSSPDYNNPKNGEYRTLSEHLAYHQTWSKENTLGLSRKDNEWAMEQIEKRILQWKESLRYQSQRRRDDRSTDRAPYPSGQEVIAQSARRERA